MNATTIFNTLFILFLCGNAVVIFYLYFRQKRSLNEHRNKIPHEFSRLITLTEHQKASDLALQADTRELLRQASLLLLIALFTLGGVLQWLNHYVTNIFGFGLAADTILIVLISLIFLLANSAFFSSASTNRPIRPSLLLLWFASAALSFIVFVLWNYTGSAWWFWSWLVSAVLVYAAYRFAPMSSEHLSPLSDAALQERLKVFLHHIDFAYQGFYVSAASKDSSEYGLRINGFGRSRRIILSETLLKRLSPSEIEALLAYEVCRCRSASGFKSAILPLVFSFIFFLILGLISQKDWFFQALGVTDLTAANHGAALALFAMALYVFLLPLSPLKNLYYWNADFKAEERSVRMVDWNSLISAIAEAASGRAGDLILDSWYALFYDKRPDSIRKIIHIQKMAPRHTKQRDSWLPSA